MRRDTSFQVGQPFSLICILPFFNFSRLAPSSDRNRKFDSRNQRTWKPLAEIWKKKMKYQKFSSLRLAEPLEVNFPWTDEFLPRVSQKWEYMLTKATLILCYWLCWSRTKMEKTSFRVTITWSTTFVKAAQKYMYVYLYLFQFLRNELQNSPVQK